MRACSRSITLLLLAIVAAVTVMTAGASARVLEILNGGRGFREVWRELEFISSTGGTTVRCAATLEGEFDTLAVAKTAGTNIGYVTRASLGACTGGSATVLTGTLPWELNYEAFTGTLPNIASIRQALLRAAFQVRNEIATCLARSEASHPLYVISSTTREARGLLEMPSLRMEEGQSLPLGGGFLCEFATGRIAGTSTQTVLGETAKLTLRLIEAVPTATFTPATVNILVGQTMAERAYLITNTSPVGGANIRINAIGLSDATRFRVNDTGTCTNRVIAPQGTCQFDVNYVGGMMFEAERPKATTVTAHIGGVGSGNAVTTAQ